MLSMYYVHTFVWHPPIHATRFVQCYRANCVYCVVLFTFLSCTSCCFMHYKIFTNLPSTQLNWKTDKLKDHDREICNFVTQNPFQTTYIDHTNSFPNNIRKMADYSKPLIPQELRWIYLDLDHSAPTIRGVIKIQKPKQTHPPYCTLVERSSL